MTDTAKTGAWLYSRAAFAAFQQIGSNNLALIAAGVAFFSMLSIFPALAAVIAILSLFADPVVVVAQLEEVRGLMPDEVYRILNRQIVGLVSTSSDTLGWAGGVSLAVALWSARAGVGAMMNGLNAVYNERNRSSIRHYLRALMLTASLVGVGIVALLSVVVAPVMLAFFPLGWVTVILAELLRWTIAIGVIFAGVGVLYRFGPNRRHAKAGWLSAGSLFAVSSWAVVSIAFSYYVANFGNYNEVYGSIGAVIAMLVWLWISSFLVLLGAAFNAEIELRSGDRIEARKARKAARRIARNARSGQPEAMPDAETASDPQDDPDYGRIKGYADDEVDTDEADELPDDVTEESDAAPEEEADLQVDSDTPSEEQASPAAKPKTSDAPAT